MDLKPIEKSSLSVGTRLAADVHDENGRLLLKANTLLAPNHLELLEKLPGEDLFVDCGRDGVDCEFADDKQSTPGEVIKQLEEVQNRCESGRQFVERKHNRKSWNTVLRLDIEEKVEGFTRHRQIEVATVDISAGGCAFMSEQFIEPQTTVRARFEGLKDKPVLIGVVRSCIPIDRTQHRVGVQFAQRSRA